MLFRSDLRILADACKNSFTKTQIMQEADSGHHSPYGRRTAAIAPELGSERALSSDPFAGFSFNKAQIARIRSFMKAVDTKKKMAESARQLKSSDLKTATVREYMEKYRVLQKFERIHQR